MDPRRFRPWDAFCVVSGQVPKVLDVLEPQMATDLTQNRGNRTLRRLAPCVLLLLGLALPGCTSANLRGDPFAQDEWSTLPQSFRRADETGPPTAYSNKARQIEQNLGVR